MVATARNAVIPSEARDPVSTRDDKLVAYFSSLASMVIFAFSSFEIGQFFSAVSAA